MASALDRLLKKYTLEDSGSGVGSTGRKTLPLYPSGTTPAVTLPTPAAADPYADIRNLDIVNASGNMAALTSILGENEMPGPTIYMPLDPGWDYARYGAPTADGYAYGGLPQQYQSKYGAIKDAGNGRVVVTMQQPGAHKYDTMDVYYKQDPASGKWVMDGNPVNTRQISSREEWKDTIEPMAALGLLAGAAYLGGTQLAAAEGGAAGAGGAAAGGGAAGAGGMTTAEQIALMTANGMTDAEIAAALAASGDAAGAASLTGAGMGGAAAGALPTAATDATLSQLPADYLGQSSITGTMPAADPSWFNPELLKAAAPTVAEKVTESKPDYTANPYSDPSRSLDTLPPSLNDTDPSWLDSLQGYGQDVVDWAKKNPGIAKLLFGATGAVLGGTGGSSGGGYSYSGPMPTISRQGWSPTAQQQTMLGGPSMGMLDVKPGEAMSGLWRYGLLGGGGK